MNPREYHFRASHASFRVTDKEGVCETRASIRAVALELFRRVYGWHPTKHYFCGRSTYWCMDRRGNHLSVDRIDRFSRIWWYRVGLEVVRDLTASKRLALPERGAA